jgi:hypothetical protein
MCHLSNLLAQTLPQHRAAYNPKAVISSITRRNEKPRR